MEDMAIPCCQTIYYIYPAFIWWLLFYHGSMSCSSNELLYKPALALNREKSVFDPLRLQNPLTDSGKHQRRNHPTYWSWMCLLSVKFWGSDEWRRGKERKEWGQALVLSRSIKLLVGIFGPFFAHNAEFCNFVLFLRKKFVTFLAVKNTGIMEWRRVCMTVKKRVIICLLVFALCRSVTDCDSCGVAQLHAK